MLHRAGKAWSATPLHDSADPSAPRVGPPPALSFPLWQQPGGDGGHDGDGGDGGGGDGGGHDGGDGGGGDGSDGGDGGA